MAPAVSLPIREMQNLPDCKKRWADVEDTGTPSPWTEYPFPEFKPSAVWPDTPHPMDAVCDPTLAMKNPMLMEMPENIPPSNGLPLQTVDVPYPILAQSTPASLSEMLVPCTTGPVEGPYVVLAQTCPAVSEMGVPCTAGPVTQTLQQNFTGYEVQWPGFAMHQQSGLKPLQQAEQWTNASNGSESPAQMEACIADSSVCTARTQSKMELRHSSGNCRPCAWFWRQQGCRNGDDCGYCHLCPEGELKSRKKTKIAAMRAGVLTPMKNNSQAAGAWGLKLDSLIQETP